MVYLTFSSVQKIQVKYLCSDNFIFENFNILDIRNMMWNTCMQGNTYMYMQTIFLYHFCQSSVACKLPFTKMTISPCYPSMCPDGSQQNQPIEPIFRINFYHVRPCQSIKNINRPVKLLFWDLPPNNKLNKNINKVSRKQLFISSPPHSKVKFCLLVA